MLTATVPLDGGALPDVLGGAALAHLLATPSSGLDALPSRPPDPAPWFPRPPAARARPPSHVPEAPRHPPDAWAS